MRAIHILAPFAALALFACAPAPVREITPVSASIRGATMVSDVTVKLSPLAMEAMMKFEEKARANRAADGLQPVSETAELEGQPTRDQYSGLPFGHMFELVVKDVTRDWGLNAGRPVNLNVEIDTLKTANAAMALLAGSNDQLAGTVSVIDAASGSQVGEFYVDVINSHSGLLGLAMRGGGIREKLAEEFALHISRQLTGRKNKAKRG